MGIRVNEEKLVFQITTPNTTYLMGVLDGKYLGHMYYGKRMEDMEGRYLIRTSETENDVAFRRRRTV